MALLSAFSSSALANSGGSELQTDNPNFEEKYYGNNVNLANNNVIFNEGIEGITRVYGAYTEDNDKDVSGNQVTVSGSTIVSELIPNTVYGSFIHIENSDVNVTSKANQNTVNISDGVVSGGNVRAGYIQVYADGTASAEANDNTVTFSQFEIDEVQGGRVEATSYNADASSRANGNKVTINDNSTVRYNILAGGYSTVTANNGEALSEADYNTVTISQSSVGDAGFANVYGGYAPQNYGISTTANANHNTVIVTDSTITGDLYGGNVDAYGNSTVAAYANNNAVTISGENTSVSGDVYGGYSHGSIYAEDVSGEVLVEAGNGEALAEANYNTLTISQSTVGNSVFGGGTFALTFNESATTVNAFANKNTIVISDTATINGYVFGGIVESYDYDSEVGEYRYIYGNYAAQTDKNTVTVSSSTINNGVRGGYANVEYVDGNVFTQANDNTVTIVSGSHIKSDGVFGGYVDPNDIKGNVIAKADNNSITISDSTIEGSNVYSGYADADDIYGQVTVQANNNKLIVANSRHSGSYMAASRPYASAYAGDDGNATANAYGNNNVVTVSEGTYEYVFGSRIKASAEVDDENAVATANAYGNNNTITVSSATINDYVYGARVETEISGNGTTHAEANNNTVGISLSPEVKDTVYGGRAEATADVYDANGVATANAYTNGNTVTVSSSTINDYVYAGRAQPEISGNGTAYAEANNNTVNISLSTMVNTSVYGGDAYAYAEGEGDNTTFAYANYNTVAVLDGATVKGDIYGGYADAYAGKSNTEQASYNTVTIDSSKVEGDRIAGGAVYVDDSSDSHTATHNTVNISGTYTISSNVSLWGGYYDDDGDGPSSTDDLFTGNTLNLDARQQNGTTAVKQVANFETINIQVGEVASDDVILTTSGAILGDGNGKGTTVNLLSVDTGNLDAKDRIILISSAKGDLANEGQKQFVPMGNSFALGYIGQTNLETDGVVFNIEGKGANPKTKVLNESRAAEMAFLNSAADLLQDQDIHKAGKHVFGAVRGIYNKYKTGSSVDISGVGLVTGVANTWAGDSADLTGAVFVEAGWGSFDTKNSILGGVQRGDGDSYYYGTGLIGKYDVTQGLLAGLYAEAAAHVGIISTDYSNGGLSTLNGVKASYDTDSLYYAAHATAGYRWNVTESLDLDVSATYLWNYLESQEVRIAADKFDFDSVQSHRMRLAAEVGYTADKGFRPYAGVAWEREFDGKAGGSVAGYRLDEADLGGNSGLAWAGVSFEPKEGGPIKADAEIKTYFGQRKGVSGRVWVRYEF